MEEQFEDIFTTNPKWTSLTQNHYMMQHRLLIQHFVDSKVEKDTTRPLESSSQLFNSIVMVAIANWTFWFCNDLWWLNKGSETDTIPISWADELDE